MNRRDSPVGAASCRDSSVWWRTNRGKMPLPQVVLAIVFLLPATTLAADLPWDKYPQGNGLQQTYALCAPCHSFELVAQQGMSRDRWDETLDWMTEKQGMGELPPELRNQVLDYLAQAFPEDRSQKSNLIAGSTLESLPEHRIDNIRMIVTIF